MYGVCEAHLIHPATVQSLLGKLLVLQTLNFAKWGLGPRSQERVKLLQPNKTFVLLSWHSPFFLIAIKLRVE